MTRHRAFTLIEMLVATVLSAVLMLAVLAMMAAVARDRRSLNSLNSAQPDQGMTRLVQWDLQNAQSIARDDRDQSVILVGVCGIDAATLSPNGRLVQVTYRIQHGTNDLWRIQQYLDDPARPAVWQELVASKVSAFNLDPNPGPDSPIARHTRLRVMTADGSIDENLWIK
jgi:prepilin-type N-terminal cleavage/methylation domain-containing protein